MTSMTDAFAQAGTPNVDSENFYFEEMGDAIRGKIVQVGEWSGADTSKFNKGGTVGKCIVTIDGATFKLDPETKQPIAGTDRPGVYALWIRTHQNGAIKGDSLFYDLVKAMKEADIKPQLPQVGADLVAAFTHHVGDYDARGHTIKYTPPAPSTPASDAFGAAAPFTATTEVAQPAQPAPVAQAAPAPAQTADLF